MQITVIPLGTGGPGVGGYVANVQRFLRGRGVDHTLTDMGTIITGEARDLFALAAEIHALPLAAGAPRVVTQVSVDERTDRQVGLGEKRDAVLARLDGGPGKEEA